MRKNTKVWIGMIIIAIFFIYIVNCDLLYKLPECPATPTPTPIVSPTIAP